MSVNGSSKDLFLIPLSSAPQSVARSVASKLKKKKLYKMYKVSSSGSLTFSNLATAAGSLILKEKLKS